jgi:hypothetical protein
VKPGAKEFDVVERGVLNGHELQDRGWGRREREEGCG